MYTIKCDGYPLLDLRDEELMLINPKISVEVNKVGEGSFTIYDDHPYYGKLQKLKSIFEVSDEIGVIFRGRMTNDSRDFDNGKAVDLEGLMAFFNDSIVPSYNFPGDFLEDEKYISAAESGNVVEFYLNWLIDNHNSQVQDFQKFKIGNVTVSDPNNYITRSDTGTPTTMEVLKSKLFESALGGYLCIRYESDGNYIDYLSEFALTNTQEIRFGENLLNINHDSDAQETYSAAIPFGAEIEVVTEETTDDTETTADPEKVKVSLADVADGLVSGEDIYKITLSNGLHAIYSKTAVENYGWICAPVAETTWEDVTESSNLLRKSIEFLQTEGIILTDTIEVSAADLHYTDDEIRSFRIYRKINVDSEFHGISESYDLTRLEIDILNPQNAKITVGKIRLSLIEQNQKEYADSITKIESTVNDLKSNVSNKITGLENRIDGIDGTYFYIRYSAYSDGHVMTNEPQDDTEYMGTCSTNSPTAPTDYREYTWVRVVGADGTDGQPGVDGSSSYFHIKYSNDGLTFTANNGEELGDWMGTCVNNTEEDPAEFDAYTWKKIKGEDGKDGENGQPGEPGEDGKSSYFHVKYSDDGVNFTSNNGETLGDWMGTCVDENPIDPTEFSAYTWRKIVGEDGESGIDGADGTDGKSSYFFVKFSANPNGVPMTEDPDDNTVYMGTCSTNSPTAPTNPEAYTWTRCRGEDGIDGVDGTDGESSYFFVKFSANANGVPMYEEPQDDTEYMGTCSTTENVAPTDPEAYTWTKCKGPQGEKGTPGEPGADGRTSYLHIKYSNDGQTFTENNGEELGDWIGTYVDFEELDSTNFDDYTWKKFSDDVDEELDEIRQSILEQSTTMENTAEAIVFEALTSYTEKGEFDEFKETTESQLQLMSDEMSLKFTETAETIENVNGDLQQQINTITKYFTFDIDGMTIGSEESPYKVIIDNDRYSMTVNGVEVMYIADGKVYTPEIEVTTAMKLFGYLITQDDYGNVNCDYVG